MSHCRDTGRHVKKHAKTCATEYIETEETVATCPQHEPITVFIG